MTYQDKLREFVIVNYEKSSAEIAGNFLQKYEKSGMELPTLATCIRRIPDIKKALKGEGLVKDNSNMTSNIISTLKKKEDDKLKIISLLSKKAYFIEELVNIIKQPTEYVEYLLDEIKQDKYNFLTADGKLYIETAIKIGGFSKINLTSFNNKTYRIGAISDNHINSKFERLDVLHSIYDRYEAEGITEVYNAGNWIEGDAKFNRYEVKNRGASKQINYFLDVYPQKKGITTYFIAGDDHEGWYWQREGLNIGEYTEMKALQRGRNDLKYLGYVEADVELHAKNGCAKMRIMHPGGGSAYAVSYSPQKMIESFQGGEKPNILLLGHYHKADYFCYRNVHCLQLGCTQDQSTFMRKRKIQAHVGAWIIEFQQAEDGSINRFKVEWLQYLNEEFYSRHGYYE